MANSPTDVSKSFVEAGMTLISQPASDRWLRLHSERQKNKKLNEFLSQAEWEDGYVGK